MEEKKSDFEDKEDLPTYSSLPESSVSSARIEVEPRECTSSPLKSKEVDDGNRASPDVLLEEDPIGQKEDEMYPFDGTESDPAVDDIAMSPIPFDREDPATLMELPEDIMTLPISPCGPNDDPALTASRS